MYAPVHINNAQTKDKSMEKLELNGQGKLLKGKRHFRDMISDLKSCLSGLN